MPPREWEFDDNVIGQEWPLEVSSKRELSMSWEIILRIPLADFNRPIWTQYAQDGAPFTLNVSREEYERTQIGDKFYLLLRSGDAGD
jgi:hypothetical protein